MAYEDLSGSERVTSSGWIGTEGKPCRVFAASLTSGGSGGNLYLLNGGSGGDAFVSETGTGGGKVDLYGINTFGANGVEFPDGCYVSVQLNTVAVVLEFRSEA